MTLDEIRENKPDGATHYDDDLNYYKVDPFHIYGWLNNSWVWADDRYNLDDYEIEPLY